MAKKFVRMNVRFPTFPQAALKLGVNETGRVQQYTTKLVMKNLEDFMPRKTGELISTMAQTAPDKVRVSTVYAKFLFFGVTKSGEQVNYSTDKNPKAGPHWDKRMVAERGKAMTAKIGRYARKQ